MVNATVDNEPVSISLASGESTAVPNGETWKVTIVCEPSSISAAGGSKRDESTFISINGVVVAGSKSSGAASKNQDNASASANSTVPFETVLKEGDTVSVSGGGAHIGGFVVKKQ